MKLLALALALAAGVRFENVGPQAGFLQAIPNGGRFVTEWTYAPGVGMIALRTTASQGGKQQEQTSLQLLRFEKDAQ